MLSTFNLAVLHKNFNTTIGRNVFYFRPCFIYAENERIHTVVFENIISYL